MERSIRLRNSRQPIHVQYEDLVHRVLEDKEFKQSDDEEKRLQLAKTIGPWMLAMITDEDISIEVTNMIVDQPIGDLVRTIDRYKTIVDTLTEIIEYLRDESERTGEYQEFFDSLEEGSTDQETEE